MILPWSIILKYSSIKADKYLYSLNIGKIVQGIEYFHWNIIFGILNTLDNWNTLLLDTRTTTKITVLPNFGLINANFLSSVSWIGLFLLYFSEYSANANTKSISHSFVILVEFTSIVHIKAITTNKSSCNVPTNMMHHVQI